MKTEQVCICDEHKEHAPTTLLGHQFVRLHVYSSGMEGWRWACSCGRKGRVQRQSPSVSYHQWCDHVRRSEHV